MSISLTSEDRYRVSTHREFPAKTMILICYRCIGRYRGRCVTATQSMLRVEIQKCWICYSLKCTLYTILYSKINVSTANRESMPTSCTKLDALLLSTLAWLRFISVRRPGPRTLRSTILGPSAKVKSL